MSPLSASRVANFKPIGRRVRQEGGPPRGDALVQYNPAQSFLGKQHLRTSDDESASLDLRLGLKT